LTSAALVGSRLVFFLLTAACAGLAPAPAREPAQIAATQDAPAAQESVAPPAASVPESPTPAATGSPTVVIEPPPPTDAPATNKAAPKPASPTVKPPAKVPAPPARAGQIPGKKTPAAGSTKPAGPPPLDLKTLETRLKETNGIGVLTKLTIKNQVDDLLDQFRAFYQGRLKTTLGELRQPYDRLVLKIVALLQDGDPPLAADIVASREEIWGILADPVRFANY